MLLSSSIGGWVVRIILAIIVFLLVTFWPLPQILDLIPLPVPHVILVLLGLLLAALTLFANYWAPRRV